MTRPPSDYRDLTDMLHAHAATTGIPLNGSFELTSRCNLACRMCYIRHDAGDTQVRARELTAKQWVSLAEQATAEGMLFLLLTGGEAFLRPDFLDIYEPLTTLGLNLTIYTNGTLVTPEMARRLEQRPPNRMEVTLYGATPETYAEVTGSADAYYQALRGLDLLCDTGITLAVKATITQRNKHELEAIRNIAHARGLVLKAGWMLSSRVDGAPCAIDTERLPVDEVMTLEANDADVRAAWTTIELTDSPACSDAVYCQAGKSAFSIAPDGAMNPCMDLPLPGARPIEIGFRAAWNAVRAYIATIELPEDCTRCAVRSHCPSCPARNYVETRSVTGVDRFCCDVAYARYARFVANDAPELARPG